MSKLESAAVTSPPSAKTKRKTQSANVFNLSLMLIHRGKFKHSLRALLRFLVTRS